MPLKPGSARTRSRGSHRELKPRFVIAGDPCRYNVGKAHIVLIPQSCHTSNWCDDALCGTHRRLASFARLIYFDRHGTGMYDRVSGVPTRAVMDDVGSELAALVTSFATRLPARAGTPPRRGALVVQRL